MTSQPFNIVYYCTICHSILHLWHWKWPIGIEDSWWPYNNIQIWHGGEWNMHFYGTRKHILHEAQPSAIYVSECHKNAYSTKHKCHICFIIWSLWVLYSCWSILGLYYYICASISLLFHVSILIMTIQWVTVTPWRNSLLLWRHDVTITCDSVMKSQKRHGNIHSTMTSLELYYDITSVQYHLILHGLPFNITFTAP